MDKIKVLTMELFLSTHVLRPKNSYFKRENKYRRKRRIVFQAILLLLSKY